MDGGEEVLGALVVARGNGPELLQPSEEVLDQVAGFVEILVVGARLLAVGLGRDHGGLAGPFERLEHALLGVERLISNHRTGLDLGQQGIGAFEVVRLPGREREAGRIAECVDRGVDLRRQATLAAPDRLGRALPPLAPALC